MPHFSHEDHTLHYDWAGACEPERATVVLLHDGLGASGSWGALPRRLERSLDANVLVYDRWGYGSAAPRERFEAGFMEAEVPVLIALLDSLGIARVALVGHSDGGSIALLCAAWHSGRIAAVVTEAAHTFVEPETQGGIRNLVALAAAGRMPGWLGRLHGERAPSLLRAWSEHWLSAVHARWDIRGELPAVRCPVLAIQGEADEFGTEAQVDSILAAIAGTSSWIVPGAGHTPHTQVEDAYLERVAAFLRPHLAK